MMTHFDNHSNLLVQYMKMAIECSEISNSTESRRVLELQPIDGQVNFLASAIRSEVLNLVFAWLGTISSHYQ